MTAASFAPFQDLANLLIPYTHAEKIDGSHDVSHLLRVWKNVCAIRDREGGDARVLMAATLLHDCVSVEKRLAVSRGCLAAGGGKGPRIAERHGLG